MVEISQRVLNMGAKFQIIVNNIIEKIDRVRKLSRKTAFTSLNGRYKSADDEHGHEFSNYSE